MYRYFLILRRTSEFLSYLRESDNLSSVLTSWSNINCREDSQDCHNVLFEGIEGLSLFLTTGEMNDFQNPTHRGLLDGTLKIKQEIGKTKYLGTIANRLPLVFV